LDIPGYPYDKHARLLVEYCISARDGDEVVVSSTYEALPLVIEIVRELASRGAYPYVVLRDETISEAFLRYATNDLLQRISHIEKALVEIPSAMISVTSSTHTKYLASLDPTKLSLYQRARIELNKTFLERAAKGELRWVVTAYPTKAMAQEAGMSFLDFANFVIDALKLREPDPIAAWRSQASMQEKIVNALSKHDEIKIVGENVDLTLRVGGRKWISDDGKNNMPGGEVFTAPIEDSIDGWILFEYPAVYRGYEVEGVKLVFRKGIVVEADAVKGRDVLLKLLQVDEGAKRVGEFAFGLNYSIKRAVKMILFDEKIGGTIHMALGSAYPETGGQNVSAIHWDLIKDCSRVRVYADGELIYENGRFLMDVL